MRVEKLEIKDGNSNLELVERVSQFDSTTLTIAKQRHGAGRGQAVRFYLSEQQKQLLTRIQRLPLLEQALREAMQDCSCSPRERLSGHLTSCRVPEWELLLKGED